MDKDQIKPQRTYRAARGKLLYVQDITGQRVTYCVVGSVDRSEASLGRFAAMVDAEVPNQ